MYKTILNFLKKTFEYKRFKRYPHLSFCQNFLGGHISLGSLTIYGENAMHWGVTIRSKRYGYICFRLPFKSFGRWIPLYFFLSPNATPWASTFYIGQNDWENQKELASKRRKAFGHNFDTEICSDALGKINNY